LAQPLMQACLGRHSHPIHRRQGVESASKLVKAASNLAMLGQVRVAAADRLNLVVTHAEALALCALVASDART